MSGTIEPLKTNTFRFQTFREQLAESRTRVDYFGKETGTSADEAGEQSDTPNLLRAIQTRSELDLTANFNVLVQNIGCDIQTLPQILYRADDICRIIISHISLSNAESFCSIYTFLEAVSKDLGILFDSHRIKTLTSMISVLSKLHDAEIVVRGFHCLSNLLVDGRQHFSQNIDLYVTLFAPILQNHGPDYLYRLVAQCLSPILRITWKVKQNGVLASILKLAKMPNTWSKGISEILSELMRGPQASLWSKGVIVLEQALALCLTSDSKPRILWKNIVVEAIIQLFRQLNTEAQKSVALCIEEYCGMISDDISDQVRELRLELYGLVVINADSVWKSDIIKFMDDTSRWKGGQYLEDWGVESMNLLTSILTTIAENSEAVENLPKKMFSRFFQSPNLDVRRKTNLLSAITSRIPVTALADLPFYEFNLTRFSLLWMIYLQRLQTPNPNTSISESLPSSTIFTIGNAPAHLLYVDRKKSHVQFTEFPRELLITDSALQISRNISSELSNESLESVFSIVMAWSHNSTNPTLESFLHFFPTNLLEFELKKLDNIESCPYLRLFLLSLHELAFVCCLKKNEASVETTKQIDNFLTILKQPWIREDCRDIWILKCLDFLLRFLEPGAVELEIHEMVNILDKYLNSGYKLYRATAISVLWNTVLLHKRNNCQEFILALSTAFKLESLDKIPQNDSEINRLFDVLIRSSHIDRDGMPNFLFSLGQGLLYSNYTPLRKSSSKLISSCCKSDARLTNELLNTLHYPKETEYTPAALVQFNSTLPRISSSFITQYEREVLGYSDLFDSEHGYASLNQIEFWSNMWQLMASNVELSSEADFRGHCVEIFITVSSDYVLEHPFFGTVPSGKPVLNFLVAGMKWLSKVIASESQKPPEEWKTLLIHFLMSNVESVQKAAVDAAFTANSKLRDYRESITEALSTGPIDLTGFALEAAEPIVRLVGDRNMVMDHILPRIAVSFKHNKRSRKPILIGLLGFSLEENKRFLELNIGGVENPGHEKLDVKILVNRVRRMGEMLDHWKNTFPDCVRIIITQACGILKHLHFGLSEPESEIFAPTIRELTGLGVTLLSKVYNFAPNFLNTNFDLLEMVWKCILQQPFHRLVTTASGGVSSTLNLIHIWSSNPQNHPLLLKEIDNVDSGIKDEKMETEYETKDMDKAENHLSGHELHHEPRTPVDYLGEILVSSKTSSESKRFVLQVLENLFGNEQSGKGDETKDLREYRASEIGIQIIERLRPILLYLPKYFPEKILHKRTLSNWKNYLAMMRTVYEQSPTIPADSLSLFLVNNLNEEKLFPYLEVVQELVTKCPKHEGILIHLSTYLRCCKDKEIWSRLFKMLDMFQDGMCWKELQGIKANEDNDLINPNWKERKTSWSKLRSVLNSSQFSFIEYVVLGNIMMGLVDDEDATTARSAMDLLEFMSIILGKISRIPETNKFLDQVILFPSLEIVTHGTRLRQTFRNRVRALRYFIKNSKCHHNILEGLSPLVSSSEDDDDVLSNITDIKISNQAKGLNELHKLLGLQGTASESDKPFKGFGNKMLRSYLVPLADHFLFCEKNTKNTINSNVLDCAVNIYGVAASLCTPQQFALFLGSILTYYNSEMKDPTAFKRYRRLIVLVLKNFRYTLVDQGDQESKLIRVLSSDVESIVTNFQPLFRKLEAQLLSSENAYNSTKSNELLAESFICLSALLRRFPPNTFNFDKEPIIRRLCSSLRAQQHAARRPSRITLLHIVQGTTKNDISLRMVASCLKDNLKVGFQKHVLSNMLSTLLSTCESRCSDPSDFNVKDYLEICEDEFFGSMFEEKKVGKITGKTSEARRKNGENILLMCGKYVSTIKDLEKMFNAAFQHLQHQRTEKIASQAKKWLLTIENGLSHNQYLNVDEILKTLEIKNAQFTQAPNQNHDKTHAESNLGFLIKQLPRQYVIADCRANERDLMLLLRLKIVYNVIKKGRYDNKFSYPQDPIKHLAPYFKVAAEHLTHPSVEINILSHQVATLFLNSQSDLEESLLEEEEIKRFWRTTVGNITKFYGRVTTDTEAEKFNVVLRTLIGFLNAYPSWTLLKDDVQILLTSCSVSLVNGYCTRNIFELLTGIIRKKLDDKFLKTIMEEILKLSVRSTTHHIVEGCQKLYMAYILEYKTYKNDGLSGFLALIWEQAQKAEQLHEKIHILKLLEKIICEVPAASFTTFAKKIPMIALRTNLSDTTEIKAAALTLLKTFTASKDHLPLVCQFGIALLKKKPPNYDPRLIEFSSVIFNECMSSDSLAAVTFCDCLTDFVFDLLRADDDGIEESVKLALLTIEEAVRKYWIHDGKKGWCASLEKKWSELIVYLSHHKVTHHQNLVKSTVLTIIHGIMARCNWNIVLEFVNGQDSGQSSSVPFLTNDPENFKMLIMNHVKILVSKSPDTSEKVGENLKYFLQVLPNYPEVNRNDIAEFLIEGIRNVINREIQLPKKFTIRKVCYPVLRAYVHLADFKKRMDVISSLKYKIYKSKIDEEYITESFILNIRKIIAIAQRDISDSNVIEEVRKDAEDLCVLIQKRIGSDLYNSMEVTANEALHDRRRKNKARKAEGVVLRGTKRSRSKKGSGPRPKKSKI